MPDYEPLDLSKLCNADASILGEDKRIPSGPQAWHGLPFCVGPVDGSGPCVIACGVDISMEPVTIPIGRTARHVIVAHRLLDSKLNEGGPLGETCAEYAFEIDGEDPITQTIGDRYEIATIPPTGGGLALLAYADRQDSVREDRYEGPWGASGWRQAEATAGSPRDFYLYCWENPHPDKTLGSLLVTPKGPRFYIGAITLGHLAEFPFVRTAKQDVKVILHKEQDAQKPFKMEVEVDRGFATYPYPLPSESTETYLQDDFKGWGQERNTCASPAYVQVSATPSATVTVKQDGEVIGSVRWGELTEKKKVDANDRLQMILVDEGRNWVKTTVLDDETGKPVPCRVHFRSSEGIPFAPHGHHPHINSDLGTWHIDIGGDVRLGQISYAYINGMCQGWLPRGEVIVDIARGYEYQPIRRKIRIEPGQRELTFRLKRIANMVDDRYFSGDTHVHFMSTQGAHTEAAGEGLKVVNVLLTQLGHLFTNTEEFTGRPSLSGDGETIVYASQENRQHILGHLSLLGLKDHVSPWCSDGAGEAELGGNMETTLCRWADACHEQGGTVILPHIPTPNCEPAALISTGRVDAVEFLVHGEYQHKEYYRYLNCGYKLPLVGGTDKMSSDVPVGIYRTYVHIPESEPFNYDTWCKGLKSGNTFLSSGPLLRFSVEGQAIGSTVNLPGNGGRVEVEASAISVLPFHSLEFVMNGVVVARTEQPNGTKSLSLKETIKVEKHSWIAARCAGPNYTAVKHHDGWRRGIMAHTSPVYLSVGGEWWMFDLDAANYMLTLLHGGLEYIHRRSFQWEESRVTHHHRYDDHLQFLSEPFHEAINSIHKRMHELDIPH